MVRLFSLLVIVAPFWASSVVVTKFYSTLFGVNCALVQEGALYCWGGTSFGDILAGDSPESMGNNLRPLVSANVTDIGGYSNTQGFVFCYIFNQDLYCWRFQSTASGMGKFFLGLHYFGAISAPTKITFAAGTIRVDKLFSGSRATDGGMCGRIATNHSQLICFGSNQQVTNAINQDIATFELFMAELDYPSPSILTFPTNVSAVSFANPNLILSSACAILANKKVSCWGQNALVPPNTMTATSMAYVYLNGFNCWFYADGKTGSLNATIANCLTSFIGNSNPLLRNISQLVITDQKDQLGCFVTGAGNLVCGAWGSVSSAYVGTGTSQGNTLDVVASSVNLGTGVTVKELYLSLQASVDLNPSTGTEFGTTMYSWCVITSLEDLRCFGSNYLANLGLGIADPLYAVVGDNANEMGDFLFPLSFPDCGYGAFPIDPETLFPIPPSFNIVNTPPKFAVFANFTNKYVQAVIPANNLTASPQSLSTQSKAFYEFNIILNGAYSKTIGYGELTLPPCGGSYFGSEWILVAFMPKVSAYYSFTAPPAQNYVTISIAGTSSVDTSLQHLVCTLVNPNYPLTQVADFLFQGVNYYIVLTGSSSWQLTSLDIRSTLDPIGYHDQIWDLTSSPTFVSTNIDFKSSVFYLGPKFIQAYDAASNFFFEVAVLFTAPTTGEFIFVANNFDGMNSLDLRLANRSDVILYESLGNIVGGYLVQGQPYILTRKTFSAGSLSQFQFSFYNISKLSTVSPWSTASCQACYWGTSSKVNAASLKDCVSGVTLADPRPLIVDISIGSKVSVPIVLEIDPNILPIRIGKSISRTPGVVSGLDIEFFTLGDFTEIQSLSAITPDGVLITGAEKRTSQIQILVSLTSETLNLNIAKFSLPILWWPSSSTTINGNSDNEKYGVTVSFTLNSNSNFKVTPSAFSFNLPKNQVFSSTEVNPNLFFSIISPSAGIVPSYYRLIPGCHLSTNSGDDYYYSLILWDHPLLQPNFVGVTSPLSGDPLYEFTQFTQNQNQITVTAKSVGYFEKPQVNYCGIPTNQTPDFRTLNFSNCYVLDDDLEVQILANPDLSATYFLITSLNLGEYSFSVPQVNQVGNILMIAKMDQNIQLSKLAVMKNWIAGQISSSLEVQYYGCQGISTILFDPDSPFIASQSFCTQGPTTAKMRKNEVYFGVLLPYFVPSNPPISVTRIADVLPPKLQDPLLPRKFSKCIQIDTLLGGTSNLLLFKTFQIYLNFTFYDDCPPGTVSTTGKSDAGCKPCFFGTYQPSSGQTSCLPCPADFPTTFSEGAFTSLACRAPTGRFRDVKGKASFCPVGANCTDGGATIQSLKVLPGYWRTNPNSSTIVKCIHPVYCVGGQYVTDSDTSYIFTPPPIPITSAPTSLAPTSTAPTLQGPTASPTPSAGMMGMGMGRRRLDSLNTTINTSTICLPNHTGILCETCVSGTFKQGPFQTCQACSDAQISADINRLFWICLGSFLGILLLIILYFVVTIKFLHRTKTDVAEGEMTVSEEKKKIRNSLVLAVADFGHKLRVLIGLLQVIGAMSISFFATLPGFFNYFAEIYVWFSLDLVNLFEFGCAVPTRNFFSSLLASTISPVIVVFVIFAVHCVLVELRKSRLPPRQLQASRNISIGLVLLWFFLVYPLVSRQILSMFNCVHYDDGTYVLEVDPTIDCRSPEYTLYLVYASFMVVIYIFSIPMIELLVLCQKRTFLRKPDHFPGEHENEDDPRSIDENVEALRFLWRPYRSKYYYFEVVDMIRKLLQTSILVFVGNGTALQMIYQAVVTIFFATLIQLILPFREISNNILAVLSQWVIFFITFVTLLINLDEICVNEGNQLFDIPTLNAFLAAFVALVPCVMFVQVLNEFGIIKLCKKRRRTGEYGNIAIDHQRPGPIVSSASQYGDYQWETRGPSLRTNKLEDI